MRTKAIIAKRQATNEYDQLFTCYTQELGKLVAIAKSVLKPSSLQAMQLDVLNLVEFELVSSRGVPIIAAAHSEEVYRGIKDSLIKTAAGLFFMEVVERVVYDNERDDRLWQFLLETLRGLDQLGGDDQVLSFFREQQKKFLIILGHAPHATLSLDALFEQAGQSYFESLRLLYGLLHVQNQPEAAAVLY